MRMNVFQKLMYAILSITVSCAVVAANYIYLPSSKRIPNNNRTTQFMEQYYDSNDRVLKTLFPYEEVVFTLEVPSNMSYTAADFQQFAGTYLTQQKPADESYLKRICFLGDSLTYHMSKPDKVLGECDVLAYGGLMVSEFADYTENPVYNKSNIIRSPVEWLKVLKPEIIYIMLGTNGINGIENKRHIDQYITMLDKLTKASPSTIVVICTSPPWGENAYIKYTSTEIPVLNMKINHFNMYLLELAKERGYYFLNVAEALMDKKGILRSDYASNDGLHWTDTARRAFADYVLSHPIPGMTD